MVWYNDHRLRPHEIPRQVFEWTPLRRPSFFDHDVFSRVNKVIRDMEHFDRMVPRIQPGRLRKQLSSKAVTADKETQEESSGLVSHEGDKYIEGEKYIVRLQTQGFQPDEIDVKVRDGLVIVEAEKEESDQERGTYCYRQIHERFSLPPSVDSDQVTCEMTKDGVLEIRAQLPKNVQVKDAKTIPIQQTPNEEISQPVPDETLEKKD